MNGVNAVVEGDEAAAQGREHHISVLARPDVVPTKAAEVCLWNQGRGQYYDRAIQNQITKQQARALLYYQQHGFTSVEDLKLARTSVAEGAIFVHKGIGGAGLRWRPFSADRVGRRGCPNKQKQKVPPTGGIFLFGPS